MQDVFFRLTPTKPVTPKAPFNRLFQIVRNPVIDQNRKQSKVKKQLGGSGVDTILSNSSPEASLSGTLTPSQIDASLAELPERTSHAFELQRLHGVLQKEITTALGVSNTLVHLIICDALLDNDKSVNTK